MFLRPAQIELFDHDDEEGDSDPDFMGHLIFEGMGGGFLQELAAAHEGGSRSGRGSRRLKGSETLRKSEKGDSVHLLQPDAQFVGVVHHTAYASFEDTYNEKVGEGDAFLVLPFICMR